MRWDVLLVAALSALAPMTTWCRWPALVLINRTSTRFQTGGHQAAERAGGEGHHLRRHSCRQTGVYDYDYLSAIYVFMKFVLSLNAVHEMYEVLIKDRIFVQGVLETQ